MGFAILRRVKWTLRPPALPIQNTGPNSTAVPNATIRRYLSVAEARELAKAQKFGNASGRVIDLTGRPVVNADVHAWSSRMGMVPVTVTNSHGVFIFRHLEIGKYYLSVKKDYAGYADTENRFYAAGFAEKSAIVVEEGKTVQCGDLRMGPKAGKLIGTIRDGANNKLIVSAPTGQIRKLVLSRVEDPLNSYGAGIDINGNFEVLVPPVPFRLQVVVTGYETKDLGVLSLKSGERKRLDIVLNSSN
ncbi:MAG TPA: carboxypeptidase-like regulatory domain-containing protein [Pyrinomonadaceae bacterium]|nr:carboxypeptidase-like regulatory domain-containing protein [Pyrinomonadaceae bacterium]